MSETKYNTQSLNISYPNGTLDILTGYRRSEITNAKSARKLNIMPGVSSNTMKRDKLGSSEPVITFPAITYEI